VGEIFVNGESHSLALVTHGFAWWYSKYAPNRQDLKSAQYQAKRSKIGLWKDSDALAPWTYRWQHKN
jgi:endonuclease YncB( thermonuclease family)